MPGVAMTRTVDDAGTMGGLAFSSGKMWHENRRLCFKVRNGL